MSGEQSTFSEVRDTEGIVRPIALDTNQVSHLRARAACRFHLAALAEISSSELWPPTPEITVFSYRRVATLIPGTLLLNQMRLTVL
jgi:hypothetical protein